MDAVAQAEHVLKLFDAHWFRHQILLKHHHRPPPPPSPPPLPASPPLAVEVEDAESRTSDTPPSTTRPKPPPFHRRSLSDDASHSSPESPRIRPCPKLQTILSGRVAGGEEEEVASSGDVEVRIVPRRRDRRGGRRRRTRSSGAASSRSLTDLEFEELKGFMDLGFTFSEAEADPRLIAIVPGLQRLRAEGSPSASDAGDDQPARRPYLSEAWEAAAEEEEDVGVDPLRNWRVPAAGRGVDMKDHLRCWAHAVASTVR